MSHWHQGQPDRLDIILVRTALYAEIDQLHHEARKRVYARYRDAVEQIDQHGHQWYDLRPEVI